MENFNKNWLAIILIVLVFTSIGFLLGRVTGHHPKPFHGMHDNMMYFNPNGGPGCCEEFEMPCGGEMDSLKNVDVKVIVNDDGNMTCCSDSSKKVIIKKVIKKIE